MYAGHTYAHRDLRYWAERYETLQLLWMLVPLLLRLSVYSLASYRRPCMGYFQ